MEMCFDETWGTVCNDHWDQLDVTVVCRQIGFSEHGEHMYISIIVTVVFAQHGYRLHVLVGTYMCLASCISDYRCYCQANFWTRKWTSALK